MGKFRQQLNLDTEQYEILDETGKVIFSVKLEDNQIVIKTEREVWSGPINLLTFSDSWK